MERIMKAQAYARSDDSSASFYATQKKTLEINPRHPLVRALLTKAKTETAKAEDDEKDQTLVNSARVLLDTARLRSGFSLTDSVEFAKRIERMLRVNMGVDLDAQVEAEPELPKTETPDVEEEEEEEEEEADAEVTKSKKDEDDEEEGGHDEL